MVNTIEILFNEFKITQSINHANILKYNVVQMQSSALLHPHHSEVYSEICDAILASHHAKIKPFSITQYIYINGINNGNHLRSATYLKSASCLYSWVKVNMILN